MSSERRAPLGMVGLSCLLMAAAACADLSRGPAPEPPEAAADAGTGDGAGGDAAALSFAASIEPLLAPTCGRCHVPGEQAGDTQLLFTGDAATDYATVSRFVDASAPAGSRLLSKMSGNGHGG